MWDAVVRWPIMQLLNQKAIDMDGETKAISETLALAFELLSRSRREADALRAQIEQKRMRPLDEMNAQAKQILADLCPRVSHLRQDVKANLENIANAKAGKY
ncbi:hypothetical protein EWM64_g5073 [Hericium alpestre]|uniref:Uncharacterized protein n=1 Tax=Hericium alpestre TaxID=135208 RepID=A0A4Y9ZVU6_9AGAM|nr:hypothetical protein EWM64_g5073 [Hericium alpestre]